MGRILSLREYTLLGSENDFFFSTTLSLERTDLPVPQGITSQYFIALSSSARDVLYTVSTPIPVVSTKRGTCTVITIPGSGQLNRKF